MTNYPLYVGICGAPESGKSTVQTILQRRYGILPFDDFAHVRRAVCNIYGLTDWHVETQEGKRTIVNISGQDWTVRQILGEFAGRLEAMHGQNFVAETALINARLAHGDGTGTHPPLSFGSVRLDQGSVYKREGGIVLEITRPGCGPRSRYDEYSRDWIDITIENQKSEGPGSLTLLEARIAAALDSIFPVVGNLAA